MARPIVMPSVGMFTAEGTLVAWLRPSGANVEAGESIAEIMTEKATVEIEAPGAGILHPIAEIGVILPIEGLMGYILAPGEDPPAPPQAGTSPGLPSPGGSSTWRTPTLAQTLTSPTTLPAAPSQAAPEVRATPAARRVAAQHGIDLARVCGTGPGGRIVEADVMAAMAKGDALSPAHGAGPACGIRQQLPLAGLRRTIAERLRRSLVTAAPVTLTREIHADTLVACRHRLAERTGIPLPYDALFIKLLATALRAHPELNATIENDTILILDEVHVGFAVAVREGLLVPVVRNADAEPLTMIAEAVRRLSDRALSRQLRPADVEGGTATITNLGACGVDAFTPILNPPQSVILGIGRIAPRPVVSDGVLVAGHTCVLSLTFDHRAADGVPAAQLLDMIARLMNDDQYLTSLV